MPRRILSSGFVVERDELDVARFSNLADRGKQATSAGDLDAASAHFSEALGLWSGRPLSGAVLSPWL